MPKAEGVLIIGRVTEVSRREGGTNKETGEKYSDTITVYVAGPRSVEETWATDGGYEEGEFVALRCSPQLPRGGQTRLSWRRLDRLQGEALLEVAKAVAASDKDKGK